MNGADTPPVGATEALRALIGQTLDIEDVTADEDFFELGGTSLNGAVLIAQIHRRLGSNLSLADLYAAPTARGLAARLGSQGPGDPAAAFSTAALPSAHPGTTGAPVFLVHFIPPDLARSLGQRRPVVALSDGLAAVGGNTGWPPPPGIVGLAAHYVEQLRQVCPEGPYHLVGHSNGGIIAWEMARRLREAGADVGLLCLIDTRPPPGPLSRRVSWRRALRAIVSTPPRVLWLLAQRSVLQRLNLVADRLALMLETPEQQWDRLDQRNRLALIDLHRDEYRMTPLPGRTLLIEGRIPTGILSEPIPLAAIYSSAGLTPHGHIAVQLPGDHGSVVRAPLAEAVAAAIHEAIRSYEDSS